MNMNTSTKSTLGMKRVVHLRLMEEEHEEKPSELTYSASIPHRKILKSNKLYFARNLQSEEWKRDMIDMVL